VLHWQFHALAELHTKCQQAFLKSEVLFIFLLIENIREEINVVWVPTHPPSLSLMITWNGEGMVNHVITSNDLDVKWHSCSNLSTSYGSRHRHIHRAQVWVVSCVLYSRAIMALEFFLMSPGFKSFLLPRDEQNTKCGGVGGHKMHIFTTNIPTFHARYRR
jgi:hypothetical protein